MSFCIYFFDAEKKTPQQNSPQAINSHSYKIHYEYSNLLSQVSFHGIETFGL